MNHAQVIRNFASHVAYMPTHQYNYDHWVSFDGGDWGNMEAFVGCAVGYAMATNFFVPHGAPEFPKDRETYFTEYETEMMCWLMTHVFVPADFCDLFVANRKAYDTPAKISSAIAEQAKYQPDMFSNAA